MSGFATFLYDQQKGMLKAVLLPRDFYRRGESSLGTLYFFLEILYTRVSIEEGVWQHLEDQFSPKIAIDLIRLLREARCAKEEGQAFTKLESVEGAFAELKEKDIALYQWFCCLLDSSQSLDGVRWIDDRQSLSYPNRQWLRQHPDNFQKLKALLGVLCSAGFFQLCETAAFEVELSFFSEGENQVRDLHLLTAALRNNNPLAFESLSVLFSREIVSEADLLSDLSPLTAELKSKLKAQPHIPALLLLEAAHFEGSDRMSADALLRLSELNTDLDETQLRYAKVSEHRLRAYLAAPKASKERVCVLLLEALSRGSVRAMRRVVEIYFESPSLVVASSDVSAASSSDERVERSHASAFTGLREVALQCFSLTPEEDAHWKKAQTVQAMIAALASFAHARGETDLILHLAEQIGAGLIHFNQLCFPLLGWTAREHDQLLAVHSQDVSGQAFLMLCVAIREGRIVNFTHLVRFFLQSRLIWKSIPLDLFGISTEDEKEGFSHFPPVYQAAMFCWFKVYTGGALEMAGALDALAYLTSEKGYQPTREDFRFFELSEGERRIRFEASEPLPLVVRAGVFWRASLWFEGSQALDFFMAQMKSGNLLERAWFFYDLLTLFAEAEEGRASEEVVRVKILDLLEKVHRPEAKFFLGIFYAFLGKKDESRIAFEAYFEGKNGEEGGFDSLIDRFLQWLKIYSKGESIFADQKTQDQLFSSVLQTLHRPDSAAMAAARLMIAPIREEGAVEKVAKIVRDNPKDLEDLFLIRLMDLFKTKAASLGVWLADRVEAARQTSLVSQRKRRVVFAAESPLKEVRVGYPSRPQPSRGMASSGWALRLNRSLPRNSPSVFAAASSAPSENLISLRSVVAEFKQSLMSCDESTQAMLKAIIQPLELLLDLDMLHLQSAAICAAIAGVRDNLNAFCLNAPVVSGFQVALSRLLANMSSQSDRIVPADVQMLRPA